MESRALNVWILSPDGLRLDVTARLDGGGVNAISESISEDIVELVHADCDLTLDDADGEVERFLEGAQADHVFEIFIERETGARRPKWELAFAGVLDAPLSVTYNRKDQTVSVQAFSYSKLLEKGSAHDIKRSISGVTGTVSSGSANVTVTSTTGLAAGDTISLTNGSASEEQEILTITSGTTLTTVDTWSNAFSGADLALETPYYRGKSITWLVEQCFAEAGIDHVTLDLAGEMAAPAVQSINSNGVPAGEVLRSLLPWGADAIVGVFATSGRYGADTLLDDWAAIIATTTTAGDWTAYYAAEPANWVQYGTAVDEGSNRAWDHQNGEYYYLSPQVLPDTPSPGQVTTNLRLYDSGGLIGTVDSYFTSGTSGYNDYDLDYDPENHYVYVSFRRATGLARINQYDISGTSATAVTDTSAFYVAPPRSLNRWRAGWWLCWAGTSMRIYNGLTLETTLTTAGTVKPWTARVFDGYLAVQYLSGGSTRVRVWDTSDWSQALDDEVAAAQVYNLGTVVTLESGAEAYVGHVGSGTGTYFAICAEFLGIIPYADFEDKDCAAALRDLALFSMCTVEVDKYKTGYFRHRGTIPEGRSAIDIGVPLEQESAPVWEFYRSSVTVTGETEYGAEVEVTLPDGAAEADRLELDIALPISASLAGVVANLYLGFMAAEREEERVEIEEVDYLLTTFDRVLLGGREYVVFEPETDLLERTQALTLVAI